MYNLIITVFWGFQIFYEWMSVNKKPASSSFIIFKEYKYF
jgi:hypothetical protein